MRVASTLFYAVLFTSNAYAQNIGIGTTNPKAGLHVADSCVLFSGPTTLPASPGPPPVSNAGTRMTWYANKAAFRAGSVTLTQWDMNNIGNNSVAMGKSTIASGAQSVSLGLANSASGDNAFAMGTANTAAGNNAAALGINTDARAYGSLVIGRYNITGGNASSWIDTEPLFVVGNGYTYEVSPGVGAIQRRNAFLTNKNGDVSINGKATIAGKVIFKDTVNFNKNVAINLVNGQAASASLSVNGTIALQSSAQTITASADYVVETTNKGFVKLYYNESASLNPALKLKPAVDGQLLVIQHAGAYPFKIYGGINYPGFAIVRLSALYHTIKKFDTLVLIYSSLTGWLQLSFSPYG